MTLLNPILNGKESATRQSPSFETIFIKAHGVLFTSNLLDFPGHSNATVYELEIDSLIRQYIVKSGVRLKETGVLATISYIAALFAYGGVYTSMKSDFPDPAGTAHRSLSEDFLIRGQLYAQPNFPESWFIDAMIDDNEGSLDLPLILQPRLERMLWLSRRFTHMDHSSRVKEYAIWMSRGLERARFVSTLWLGHQIASVFAFANMESFADKFLGIAMHTPKEVLPTNQRICSLGPERSWANGAISGFLPCTIRCFFSACREWKSYRQFRQGRRTLQYCVLGASARRFSIRWILSSSSRVGSFLSCQKGPYPGMGMHDGYISIWLVGREE